MWNNITFKWMTLDALTPASVHSLWSSPKCFESALLDSILEACGYPCCLCTFLTQFLLPSSQLCIILCFDTALLEQPLLSVMTFCDLPSLWKVSMIIFWTIAKSAVQEILRIYTVWMVIYWNVNIRIFWDTDFWLSLAVSSNHQN